SYRSSEEFFFVAYNCYMEIGGVALTGGLVAAVSTGLFQCL
ncbi:hypothetical protein IFM89_025476, partial [Coptis chinensis]